MVRNDWDRAIGCIVALSISIILWGVILGLVALGLSIVL